MVESKQDRAARRELGPASFKGGVTRNSSFRTRGSAHPRHDAGRPNELASQFHARRRQDRGRWGGTMNKRSGPPVGMALDAR